MNALLIQIFVIGFSLGALFGLSLNRRKINKTIKEAKEQVEISKKLIAEQNHLNRFLKP